MQWSPLNDHFAYLHKTMNGLDVSNPVLKTVSIVTCPLTEEQAHHGFPSLDYGSKDLQLQVDSTCNFNNSYRFWLLCNLQYEHLPIPVLPIAHFAREQEILTGVYSEFEQLITDRRFKP